MPSPFADILASLAHAFEDIDDVMAILAAHPDDLNLELVRGTVRMLEEALDQSDLSSALDQALTSAHGALGPPPLRPSRRAAKKAKRKR